MDKKISIFEVGPRDGLQNIKNEIPTNKKTELINIPVSYTHLTLPTMFEV